MSHRTIWISRIRLKKRDFVLVNDGMFGIDIETPVASRMFLGYHEHCNSLIQIRRHRVEVNSYLTFLCGGRRCGLGMKIKFKRAAELETFTLGDLRLYCQRRIERKRQQKRAMKLLCSLDPKILQELCRKNPHILETA